MYEPFVKILTHLKVNNLYYNLEKHVSPQVKYAILSISDVNETGKIHVLHVKRITVNDTYMYTYEVVPLLEYLNYNDFPFNEGVSKHIARNCYAIQSEEFLRILRYQLPGNSVPYSEQFMQVLDNIPEFFYFQYLRLHDNPYGGYTPPIPYSITHNGTNFYPERIRREITNHTFILPYKFFTGSEYYKYLESILPPDYQRTFAGNRRVPLSGNAIMHNLSYFLASLTEASIFSNVLNTPADTSTTIYARLVKVMLYRLSIEYVDSKDINVRTNIVNISAHFFYDNEIPDGEFDFTQEAHTTLPREAVADFLLIAGSMDTYRCNHKGEQIKHDDTAFEDNDLRIPKYLCLPNRIRSAYYAGWDVNLEYNYFFQEVAKGHPTDTREHILLTLLERNHKEFRDDNYTIPGYFTSLMIDDITTDLGYTYYPNKHNLKSPFTIYFDDCRFRVINLGFIQLELICITDPVISTQVFPVNTNSAFNPIRNHSGTTTYNEIFYTMVFNVTYLSHEEMADTPDYPRFVNTAYAFDHRLDTGIMYNPTTMHIDEVSLTRAYTALEPYFLNYAKHLFSLWERDLLAAEDKQQASMIIEQIYFTWYSTRQYYKIKPKKIIHRYIRDLLDANTYFYLLLEATTIPLNKEDKYHRTNQHRPSMPYRIEKCLFQLRIAHIDKNSNWYTSDTRYDKTWMMHAYSINKQMRIECHLTEKDCSINPEAGKYYTTRYELPTNVHPLEALKNRITEIREPPMFLHKNAEIVNNVQNHKVIIRKHITNGDIAHFYAINALDPHVYEHKLLEPTARPKVDATHYHQATVFNPTHNTCRAYRYLQHVDPFSSCDGLTYKEGAWSLFKYMDKKTRSFLEKENWSSIYGDETSELEILASLTDTTPEECITPAWSTNTGGDKYPQRVSEVSRYRTFTPLEEIMLRIGNHRIIEIHSMKWDTFLNTELYDILERYRYNNGYFINRATYTFPYNDLMFLLGIYLGTTTYEEYSESGNNTPVYRPRENPNPQQEVPPKEIKRVEPKNARRSRRVPELTDDMDATRTLATAYERSMQYGMILPSVLTEDINKCRNRRSPEQKVKLLQIFTSVREEYYASMGNPVIPTPPNGFSRIPITYWRTIKNAHDLLYGNPDNEGPAQENAEEDNSDNSDNPDQVEEQHTEEEKHARSPVFKETPIFGEPLPEGFETFDWLNADVTEDQLEPPPGIELNQPPPKKKRITKKNKKGEPKDVHTKKRVGVEHKLKKKRNYEDILVITGNKNAANRHKSLALKHEANTYYSDDSDISE
jgi:hypothetical protein